MFLKDLESCGFLVFLLLVQSSLLLSSGMNNKDFFSLKLFGQPVQIYLFASFKQHLLPKNNLIRGSKLQCDSNREFCDPLNHY